MMAMFEWIDKYIGTHSQREVARLRPLVRRISQLGEELKERSDDALARQARQQRDRARTGEPLDGLAVETFALVREVASRTIGLRHFDVQLLGGLALHRGQIVEMKTGEGKTLVATLPVVLNALPGRGAHVITVNDYLAERDAEWMGPIYDYLGLSVGVVTEKMKAVADRKRAYACDITYVTNHELVFDYLRDNLATERDEQVHRPLNFALVDEVDLLLLDEAGTPLIISGEAPEGPDLSDRARQVVEPLKEGTDYRVDHKSRRVGITERGWSALERALGIENLAEAEHLPWQHAIHNALLAHAVYHKDVDYVARDEEILLVDDHTGRVSQDKRLSDGLHQALEAKEGVLVQQENQTLAKVSYQMFFRKYPVLCGMTGTAYSARREIGGTYGLQVVKLPTNRPVARADYPDVVFRSSDEKFEAVVAQIQKERQRKRPVLVGTTSVKESEHLSQLLRGAGIEHTVLNAKDDSAEAAILAEAGRPGAVTVSTNMAGRGVDIRLGRDEAEREVVLAAGGLMVMGTGLHESRRLDDQLRGRAGRQGDPGGSRFFLSLDDPVYRKFGLRDQGSQVIAQLRRRLSEHPPGSPVTDRDVLRALHDLREKVDIENEAIRKEVLRYDMVIDQQRSAIYGRRQQVLELPPEGAFELLQQMVSDLLDAAPLSEVDDDQELRLRLRHEVDEAVLAIQAAIFESNEVSSAAEPPDAETFIEQRLSKLERMLGAEGLGALAARVLLVTVDEAWTAHLAALEGVDDAVGLRGYAGLDHLLEFKRDAHEHYREMLARIRISTIVNLVSLEPELFEASSR